MQQSDIQAKAYEENAADFRRLDDQIRSVREAARARLMDNGWEPDSNDGWRCLACPCPGFEDGPNGQCGRDTCKHPFGAHDIPV
ncbi:hypothetical protein C9J60_08375 [Streptomyces sp. A244]|uniref:hypothetical protein n=1 Tax=Streptomyces sp. A244 TaxID=2137016 RepID=UPI000D1B9C2A|nr:hypothetical protein [Streptomyces sp. A244]PTH88839.1 hypothetical protein C9J60_08375 [Streptomyces sp. A244]